MPNRQLEFTDARVERLRDIVRQLLDYVGQPPEPNCTCHLGHPPCHDCTDNFHLRELIAEARQQLDEDAKNPQPPSPRTPVGPGAVEIAPTTAALPFAV